MIPSVSEAQQGTVSCPQPYRIGPGWNTSILAVFPEPFLWGSGAVRRTTGLRHR